MRIAGGAKHVEAEDAQCCKSDDGEYDLTDEIFYFATHFKNSFYHIFALVFMLVRDLTFSFSYHNTTESHIKQANKIHVLHDVL